MYSFLRKRILAYNPAAHKSNDPKWSEKVTQKIDNTGSSDELPEGLFTKQPGTIAQTLKSKSDSFEQAMQRLQFYINRAGENLNQSDLTRLEQAKEQLRKLFGK